MSVDGTPHEELPEAGDGLSDGAKRDEQRWLTALVTSWILPVGLLALVFSMSARFGYPSPLPFWADILVMVAAGFVWIKTPWGRRVAQWLYERAEDQSWGNKRR